MTLQDLTANEEIMTNDAGGKQSYTPARFDLIPPEVVADLAIVLGEGAKKYGEYNWCKIPVNDHMNHAMQHVFAFLANENYEDLTHALCRLLFAAHIHQYQDTKSGETPLESAENTMAMEKIRKVLEQQEQDVLRLEFQLAEKVYDLDRLLQVLADFSPDIYNKITTEAFGS